MSCPISVQASRAHVILKLIALLILGLIAEATTTAVYAQTEENIVAIVNGRRITQKEVDSATVSQLLPLQQQIYALRKTALENLITRIVLENEAKKRGVSVEGLKKQLTVGSVEIPTSQVEQAYLENASAFGAMNSDEAKERIRLDLESQARMRNYREAISRLKENSSIELHLEEPKLPSINGDKATPSMGAKEAAITITEFSDFQCPYCKKAQNTIKQVLQNYGNNVRIVFKHLPLEIHPQAFSAAQAAFCAGEQNRFWQYHDALFASENLSPETLTKIAIKLGLSTPNFKTCMESETSRTAVLNDTQEARQLGINGTPTFIINGKFVRGALGFEEFKGIIEQELKSAQINSRQK